MRYNSEIMLDKTDDNFANQPVLELHNLTVTYQHKPALWNIDINLYGNHLVGVIGPNGSGKTTMLKAIMGLIVPNSGYVKILGRDLSAVRSRIAYVPQRGSVDWDFPIDVFETVLMGRYRPGNLFSRPSREDKDFAMDAIRRVNLEPFINRQISQLSGGQQQRVFIARALAQQADLYLLDEPFAGVDVATENAIIELLQEKCKEGKTILVVHHDLQTVTHYFDWLIMLNTRLIAAGPTDEVYSTQNIEKTYGGRLNILSEVVNLVEQQDLPVQEK